MKQAMIFAAGLGTRLRPLTDTIPKALVPVGGKPLLQHVIERLQAVGVERSVVNIHHFGDQIIDFLDRHDRFGLDIRISDEREALLETGGGIKKARLLFDSTSPILIHNVDILSNADLAILFENFSVAPTLSESYAQAPFAALLVSERPSSRHLLFDKNYRLVGWQNTKTGEMRGQRGIHALAFSGIHVFHPELFLLMDEWPERFSIIDFYLSICAEHTILGIPSPKLRLMDVGKLDTLSAADTFLASL